MSKAPTEEPFFRVFFGSTDDFLLLSAALDSKANADKVRAALARTPPAILLETSPNSNFHPVWFVNRSGQSLVLELGRPVTFGDAIKERQLPRGLQIRLGELNNEDR